MDARPTIMASTPYLSNLSFAIWGVVISPFPIIGICIRIFSLTLPIKVQSASPVYIWLRVRPWIVNAAIPQSCNRSAKSTIILDSQSQPNRVFTVTGTFIASTTAFVILIIRGISLNIPAPAPLPATFFTGQPKFISKISGFASAQICAASTIVSTSLP